MSMLKVITLAVIALTSVPSATAFDANTDRAESIIEPIATIEYLTPFADQAQDVPRKALLELKITNKNLFPITIPLFAVTSISSYSYVRQRMSEHSKPQIRCLLNGKDASAVSQGAKLQVSWRALDTIHQSQDEQKQEIDLSALQLKIKPGHFEMLPVPILIPQANGKYKLKVTLDNLNLYTLIMSYSSRDPRNKLGFLKQTLEATVETNAHSPSLQQPGKASAH